MMKNFNLNKFLIIIIICNTSFFFLSAQNSHWKSIVPPGAQWEYSVPQSQLSNDWNVLDFDSSTWQKGPSSIGYGDNDDSTIIDPTSSVYMRMKFDIDDISIISRFIFDIDYDDGYIAYINGVEIGRNLLLSLIHI